MNKAIKNLLLFGAIVVGFSAAMWVMALSVRPNLEPRPLPTAEEIAAAKAARDVSFDPDPTKTPSLHLKQHVDPTGQSPILEQLVSEGKLPPLKDRLPKEPVVLRGVDGIGNYGGVWRRLANQPSDAETITYRMSGASLMRWSPLGEPIEPHIAKSLESSEDKREWTVTLREGMRWSDGHPYTTDDVMYWWEHEANNRQVLATLPAWLILNGKPGRIERIDKYKFKIIFQDPYLTLPQSLVTRDMCDQPAHYLRPLHPQIGDKELCERLMNAYKQPSRGALYSYMKQVWNPEHPRLWPWVYRTFRASPPQVFVRNPYYYAVDAAGNQLPYIDRIQFDVQDPKILALTAANGGATMQDRHIRFQDYTELMSRREISGTRILHWYPASRSVWVINPNQNRRVDPDDPATAWKAKFLSDKRFRQALSLAINRKQIIQADYSGVGEPSQVAPGPESPFHHEGLAKAFIEYDPERADKILDEIGLDKRDIDDFRTFPDGSRMVWFLDVTSFTGIGPAQFVADDWAAVGIRCIIRDRNRPLFYAEKDSMSFDFNVWTGESDYAPLLSPRYLFAFNSESFYAVGWGKWFQRGGLYDFPASRSKGSIPVPKDHPMYEAMVTYDKAQMATTFEEQKRLMDRVMDIAAENLWSINIATAPPQLVVVKQGLKNVPSNALYGNIYWTPANAGIETYFWENPVDSEGGIAETKQAIEQVTPRTGTPAKKGAAAPAGSVVGSMIRWGMAAIFVLLVVMLGIRHPFIMRRLFIMIPTLLIISVAVFVIIQLPPGDFLTTKIIQLQESGDATDLRAIEDLKQLFRFEEPGWKQYLRWMGLYWFATFDTKDTGLLQGNLGRSMENQQFVNDIVGDSILLTVLLSLGTIVFTWATALPIGIYSAVKQYSIGDYVLTLAGFIGMCVPGFLLALVLMAISGGSGGLFSERYATQPEWDWGKVNDLMKHMWIPVIVLGVGGTAGMIRIMRANLLDELRKPYVITAMAKGVRPTKLLVKYPVRMALNPFVSGIGALFPQLVSGGAIVSVVLALPTVGPIQIAALMNQDMYLAGSMLMVLSILGVVGTLISDMLLLWLDPRIRFEGGTR